MTGPGERGAGGDGRLAPVLVRDIEISRGVPGIVGSADGARRYAAARLLVRIHQIPIGVVSVPLTDGDASAKVVAGRVFDELAEAISDHLAADGIPMPDDLSVAGLPAHDDVPRCRRRLDGGGANAPLVSVVVCGGGRRMQLARCLRSVLKSSHPHFEVLVVDNSPDAAVQDLIAGEFANEPRIRHLYESAPGLSAARNTGLRFARGAVVAFTDDDMMVNPGWLATLTAAFDEDEDVLCVTGSVLPAELETLEQRCVDARRGTGPEFRRRLFDLQANRDASPLYPYRLESYGSGANMAWRKSALTDLWGFDLSLGPGTPTGAGEDLDAFLDVLTRGMKILHEPAALVQYTYDDDFLTLRRQVRRQAGGVTGVLTKRLLTDPRHRTALLRKAPTAVRIGMRSALGRRAGAGAGAGAGARAGGGRCRCGRPSSPRRLSEGLSAGRGLRGAGSGRPARPARGAVQLRTQPIGTRVAHRVSVPSQASAFDQVGYDEGRRRREPGVGDLDVSVVVCAYTEQRWDDLLAAVDSIRRQTHPAAEIIVVVDHNETLRRRAAEAMAGVHVVANNGPRGLSGARNTGVALARGDVVAFLDDDACADAEWLAHFVRAYRDPAVLGVGGAAVPRWPGTRPGWFPPEFDWVVGCTYTGLPTTVSPVRNPIGAGMSFRRSVFSRVGGFTHGIGRLGSRPLGCEETELGIRLRQAVPDAVVLYEPRAVVHHRVAENRVTWRYFWARCYAEGISKAVVARLVGQESALESERAYVRRVLPRAARREVAGRRLGGATAVFVGVMITTSGYVYGRLRESSGLRRLAAMSPGSRRGDPRRPEPGSGPAGARPASPRS